MYDALQQKTKYVAKNARQKLRQRTNKSESSATNLLQDASVVMRRRRRLREVSRARANQNGAFCGLRAATWSRTADSRFDKHGQQKTRARSFRAIALFCLSRGCCAVGAANQRE
jgi:hypothetical protein